MLGRRNWERSREGVSMAAYLCFHAGKDKRFLTVIPSPAPHVLDTSRLTSTRGCPGARAFSGLHLELWHWKQSGELLRDRLDWDWSTCYCFLLE